ncbi:ABC transporter permease [Nostoc sp. 'Peltigera membranacea cyanobiont' 232]|uniref:ABC transporter permease n=1 Tax=Nostoc sp. 'Peltigera membranacea cyanobiont' 232 TaxID=2014531 RepID=UPI000B953ED1|nr:ABC transporter permease [Nostoc sp. 'Peltigera membranacea cyanobiont' 232]OYE03328.1 ABC transporter permease [Nostoc sp. 'Peltigera membranacea cyanobiont' 232]
MTTFFDRILGSRFWALFRKEVSQILHNPQLLIQILIPPTLLLLLFGSALNPTFKNLRVGITDYSHSRASREFLELFSQSNAFDIAQYYANEQDMTADLAKGNLTVGITVPSEFDRDLARQRPTQVQALFDAVDANTASIASGYLSQLVGDYNSRRLASNQRRQGTGTTATNPIEKEEKGQGAGSKEDSSDGDSTLTTNALAQLDSSGANATLQRNQVQLVTTLFYNPGLEGSWFIVTGTIGILLTSIGLQAAASLVVHEKEAGTIEQLLMTPASNIEVILAKIAPLLVLLTFDAAIALTVGKIAFNLPFRGNLLVFFSISVLYFLVGISIGIMIACYVKSEQQAQLISFFISPPLILLSGGNSPIAAMPTYVQWLTYLDPLRYYTEVCRGVILKGVGLAELWSQVLILLVFAIALMGLSIRRFRNQLT